MKEKLFIALKAKCKSFGLTKKALEELVEIGASDLADDASDDDIAAKVDSLEPYAKAMQGEITRKTRKQSAKQSAKQSDDEGDGEGDGEGDDGNNAPEWYKSVLSRLDALEKENNDLKAEKAAADRAAQIASVAKKHEIPEFMVKYLHFADDADIETEMANFKQSLINNSLVPKSHTHETGDDLTTAKEAAKSWAASLPDNNLA